MGLVLYLLSVQVDMVEYTRSYYSIDICTGSLGGILRGVDSRTSCADIQSRLPMGRGGCLLGILVITWNPLLAIVYSVNNGHKVAI